MKNYLVFVVLLCLSLSIGTHTSAQTVSVCTFVDNVVPVAKAAKMCRYTSVNLSMTNCAAVPETNVSYRWRNLSKAPYTDTLKSSAMAKDTGVWVGYILNITTGIEYSDTVHLTFYPLTNLISMNPSAQAYCRFATATIALNTLGSFSSYQWYDKTTTPPSPISGATNSTYSFTNITTTVVLVVIAKDSYGCPDTVSSGSYSPKTPVPLDLGPDITTPFCQNDNTTIVNKPGGSTTVYTSNISYSYYREGTASPICSFGPTAALGSYQPCTIPLINPGGGVVKLWIKATHPIVCTNTDTMLVTIVPIPIPSLGLDSIICAGESMDIKSTIILGTAPFNYVWSSVPAGFPASGTADVTATPTVNTKYILSVTDANNCGTGTADIDLTANPPIVTTVSADTTICKDPKGIVNLYAKVTGGGGVWPLSYKCLWTTDSLGVADTLSNTTITNPVNSVTLSDTADFNATTNTAVYTFKATDINNCTSTKTKTVTFFSPPIATTADVIEVNESNPFPLNAATAGNEGFLFKWYNWIDTKDTVNNNDPVTATSYLITPDTITTAGLNLEYNGPGGLYYVVMVKSNYTTAPQNVLNSCRNTDTIKVNYVSENTLVYIPNVFSPNALDKENQHLRIYGDNLLSEDFRFSIYNKWGNLMYESTDLYDARTNGWDGGAMVAGVYTYLLQGKFKNGKNITENPAYKGTFSLLK